MEDGTRGSELVLGARENGAGDGGVVFRSEPGRGLVHPGDVPHRVERITRGERINLVVWLLAKGSLLASPDPETGAAFFAQLREELAAR